MLMEEVNVKENGIVQELFAEIKATAKEVRLKKDDEVIIRRSMEFEPFGKTTDTYEEVWRVIIPSIRDHWKSTKGWVCSHGDLCMQINERTLDAAVRKATTRLKEIKEQQK